LHYFCAWKKAFPEEFRVVTLRFKSGYLMSKKAVLYTLFFAVLVVGFYFTMTKLIPGFGDVKLPVQSFVRPFSFTNQDGVAVTERETDGKVYVAEYFFTTCQSICPIMNSNMRKVYDLYKDEPNFLILSHTSDPDNDNVARLKSYSDSLKVNTQRWMFLTGRKDSLYNAARISYLLDDPANNATNIHEQFLHTQFFALVDKSGKVRKIYDGLKKDEVEELKADIKKLLREPAGEKRFANNLFNN
jgi:protein SCO1/2